MTDNREQDLQKPAPHQVNDKSVSRRDFLKMAGVAGAAVGLGAGLGGVLASCGGGTTTTTGATATTAGVTETTAGTATTVAAAGGTIKIGSLTDFAIPPLVNSSKVLEALVEGTNNAGGWDIGGAKYTLELISYDTKSDPNTARSAVERLVSQDKVNVIFGDMTASNWASVTEGSKTLALVGTPMTDVYKPEYKYMFVTSKLPTEAPARLGYLPAYIGKDIKKYVLVFPDDAPGQGQAADTANTLKALGEEYEMVTFPATTTDYSAVGTKVVATGADAVIIGGSPVMFGQVYRGIRAAGSDAMVTITAEVSLGELDALIPLTELDGTVLGLMGWDTDAPNDICKQVVDFYTTKYGKWDDPSFDCDTFYAFEAALKAAGSVDNDKVSEALATGLTFQGPHGSSKMIPRADAGVPDRTVCLVMDYMDATMQGGKATNLRTVSVDDVEKSCLTTWAAAKK